MKIALYKLTIVDCLQRSVHLALCKGALSCLNHNWPCCRRSPLVEWIEKLKATDGALHGSPWEQNIQQENGEIHHVTQQIITWEYPHFSCLYTRSNRALSEAVSARNRNTDICEGQWDWWIESSSHDTTDGSYELLYWSTVRQCNQERGRQTRTEANPAERVQMVLTILSSGGVWPVFFNLDFDYRSGVVKTP